MAKWKKEAPAWLVLFLIFVCTLWLAWSQAAIGSP
jgi:hypothetical protein